MQLRYYRLPYIFVPNDEQISGISDQARNGRIGNWDEVNLRNNYTYVQG